MPAPRAFLAVVAAAACTACLDTSTVITLKADGSGTIQQRLLVSTQGLEDALGGMGFKNKGGAARSSKSGGGLKAEDLRADAARVGDGVTLVSVEPVTAAAGYQGAVATYGFRDIRKVKADQFLMPGPAGGPGGASADDRTAFTFTTTPQGTALLSLAFDDRPGKKKTGPKGPGAAAPQDFSDVSDAKVREMVRTMFRGFKVGLVLEVDGDIVRTNADYVEGRRITLMALDMDRLLADDSRLKALDKVFAPDLSLAEARPLLATLDGIKINKPLVKVEFR